MGTIMDSNKVMMAMAWSVVLLISFTNLTTPALSPSDAACWVGFMTVFSLVILWPARRRENSGEQGAGPASGENTEPDPPKLLKMD